VTALRHERPNVDFALAAVALVLELPAEAPLMLFAIGRTIGWIGHAIEQYASGQLIRPRAKYVGIVPAHDDQRLRPLQSRRDRSFTVALVIRASLFHPAAPAQALPAEQKIASAIRVVEAI